MQSKIKIHLQSHLPRGHLFSTYAPYDRSFNFSPPLGGTCTHLEYPSPFCVHDFIDFVLKPNMGFPFRYVIFHARLQYIPMKFLWSNSHFGVIYHFFGLVFRSSFSGNRLIMLQKKLVRFSLNFAQVLTLKRLAGVILTTPPPLWFFEKCIF